MNPHNANGWPQTNGAGQPQRNPEQQPHLAQRPTGSYGPTLPVQQLPPPPLTGPGPSLMPQPTSFFSNQANGQQLPGPSNLSLQASAMQPSRGPPPGIHSQQQSPTVLQHPPQSPYGLPALGPSIGQRSGPSIPQMERDYILREQQERIRQEQAIALSRQEEEERLMQEHRAMQAREMQQREQMHSPRETIPLQQPIASRIPATLHGPNGILNDQHPTSPSHGQPPQHPASLQGPNTVFNSVQQANENGLRSFAPQQPPNIANQQQLLSLTNAAAPQQTNGAAPLTQGQQPILNDALSYLDQVKVRFQEQPDVYNRFLDIMKDFKSQAIDTPGVIDRVSTLFAGHPELIQGFNTFLPPGYKIECGLNDDPNSIRVTTPMGTTVQQMPSAPPRFMTGSNGAVGLDRAHHGYVTEHTHNAEWAAQQQEHEMADPQYNASRQAALGLFAGQPHVGSDGQARYDDQGQADGQGNLSAGFANSQHLLGLEKRGPVEFNHAIGYVNKIKNRFATQPEIYKQFLDILQTYQRESKPIQDVYAQVTQLFSSAQDLLEDFKQFLPESAAQAKAQAQAVAKQAEDAAMLSSVRGDSAYLSGPVQNQAHTPRPDHQKMPPMGTFAPPSASKDNKKRRGGAGTQMASGGGVTDDRMGSIAGNSRGRGALGNVNKRARVEQGKPSAPEIAPVSPHLIPSLPAPIPPSKDLSLTNEEFTFFERVKKFLANRSTFNEFLKLCNLFNQEIIDKATVIQRSYNFLGGNQELMTWFSNFVAYDGKEVKIVNDARAPSGKVVLSNCRGLGPSYRLLPNRERLRPCGGRDETCKNVLNDAWVSHPTWASEESGFIAHRKNMYEEALHRIEEERHDYDINIEACLRTIQLLEPIAQQIKMMSEDEKYSFRLPSGIGGQSETIYQRVIKKIYGREKGCVVIRDMFDRPSAVVPILLGRLKQKAEEWKASQREWDKVWREQTNRIFWRSLDHQGIGQKQNDKRQFQPKALHTEIQTIYEEQRRQRATSYAKVPRYQYKYAFDDLDVICDASHLMLTQLHHNFVGNELDKSRLDAFLKTFIPTFFDMDREKFEEKMNDIDDATPASDEVDEETSADADSANGRVGKRGANGKKPNLLRDVLDRAKQGSKEDGGDESGLSTPELHSNDEEAATSSGTPSEQARTDPAEYRWMAHPAGDNNAADLNTPFKREDFHLYATSNIYCFFRMFQALYERLSNLKALEPRVHEDVARGLMPKAAVELGLLDKLPSDHFANTSPTANYYRQMIQMCEDVIRQDLELAHLEETLRRFYMPDGWQLYSFDKMLGAMLRFALQILVSDNKDKSLDIINLFYKDRKEDETTHQNELTYRKQVERLGKEGEIFRIRYNRPTRTAYVQVFKKDDKTFEADEMAAAARWSYYVSAYTMLDRTEGISLSSLRAPFLRRNMPDFITSLKEDNFGLDSMIGDERFTMPIDNYDGLLIRISPNNYHMLYDPYTCDWWVQSAAMRRRGLSNYDEVKENRRKGFEALFEDKDKNAWMIGMNEQDIEAVKQKFSAWVASGPEVLNTKPVATMIDPIKTGDAVMSGV